MQRQRQILRQQMRYTIEDNPAAPSSKVAVWLRKTFHRIRYSLQRLLLSEGYTAVMLILVLVNYFCLAMTIPPYQGMAVYRIGGIVIFVVNGIFTAELVLRMLAWGILKQVEMEGLKPQKPFLLDLRNYLDSILSIVIWVGVQVSWLSMFRILRFFRPGEGDGLYVIRKSRSLMSILVFAAPTIGLVFIICVFYSFWWAIYGVILFGGRLNNFCYPTNSSYLTIFGKCWPNLTHCAELWPNIGPVLTLPVIPCANLSFAGQSGRSCPDLLTNCEFRGFGQNLFEYLNIFQSVAVVFQDYTGQEAWFNNVYGVSGVGALTFWWFSLASFLGPYLILMLIPIVLLRAHRVVRDETTRVEAMLRKRRGDEGRDNDDDVAGYTEFALQTDSRLSRAFQAFVESSIFVWGMLVITFINTVELMLDWYQIPSSLVSACRVINVVCLIFFAFEMVCKVVAYGRAYFRNPHYVLDFVLLWLQLITTVTGYITLSDASVASWLDALGCLRCLRMYHFILFFPFGTRSRVMGDVFLRCFHKYLFLEIFHIVALFGFTVAGANVFQGITGLGQFNLDFSNIWYAFLSTLVMSTGEQWANILQYFYVTGGSTWDIVKAVIYVSLLLLVFHYLIPALFWTTQILHWEETMAKVITQTTAYSEYPSEDPRGAVLRRLFMKDFAIGDGGAAQGDAAGRRDPQALETRRQLRANPPAKFRRFVKTTMLPRTSANPRLARFAISRKTRLVEVAFIVCHCLAVAVYGVGLPALVNTVTLVTSAVCVAVQILMLAVGLYVFGPKAWASLGYTIIELLIVPFVITGLFLRGWSGFVFLRMFSALYILGHGQQVQIFLQALFQQAGIIVTAAYIGFILFMTFGIMGVKLFKGRFYECGLCFPNEYGNYQATDCLAVSNMTHYCNQTLCENPSNPVPVPGTQYVWILSINNFNDPFQGMISVLRIALSSQWDTVMYDGIFSQGLEGACMVKDANPANGLYFYLAVIVFQCIAIPWFIAVVAYSVSLLRVRVPVYETLDDRQKTYLQLMLYHATSHTCRPDYYPLMRPVGTGKLTAWQRFRRKLLALVHHPGYALAFVVVDLGYFVLLCSITVPNPTWEHSAFLFVGAVLAAAWTGDVALKIVAMGGFVPYWQTHFFRGECLCLVADYVLWGVSLMGQFQIPFGTIRMCRLLHAAYLAVAALLPGANRNTQFYEAPLHPLLEALRCLLPGIGAVALFYLVILGMISVFCVATYSSLDNDGYVITDNVNFRNWASAMVSANNMALNDFWVEVLSLQSQGPPFCYSTINTSCVNVLGSVIPILAPTGMLLIIGLAYSIAFDVSARLDVDHSQPTHLLKAYARAWRRTARESRTLPAPQFIVLWRYLESMYKSSIMHVSLDEYTAGRKSKEWVKRLRNAILFWPINPDFEVYFTDGVGALVCTMAEVGYAEHCLLQQLLQPEGGAEEMDLFFTVHHLRLAILVHEVWKEHLPLRLWRIRQLNRDAVNQMNRWQLDRDTEWRLLLDSCEEEDEEEEDEDEENWTTTPSSVMDEHGRPLRQHPLSNNLPRNSRTPALPMTAMSSGNPSEDLTSTSGITGSLAP